MMRSCVLIMFLLLGLLPVLSEAQQFQATQYISLGVTFDVSYDLVSCDLNNDGNPDLVVADYENPSVTVFLGKGDGTFFPPQHNYTDLHPIISVACGDFNHDGNTDLLAVERENGIKGNADVFLGDGSGTFSRFASYPVGVDPIQVRTADLDGDGHLDFALTQIGSVLVVFGNGDGTFARQAAYLVPGKPNCIAVGDVNGDGRPDLAVTNSHESVFFLINQGSGIFARGNRYTVPNRSFPDALADLNHDGKLDLLVGSFDPNQNLITVQLGNGDGTFGAPASYMTTPGGSFPTTIVLADVNGDGNLDVITANEEGNSSLLYGNGDGSLQTAITLDTGSDGFDGSVSAVSADFNRDGFPDLAFGTTMPAGGIALLINAQ